MIAIAVDDEVLMLGALVKAISASPDISEVASFSNCEEALAFVNNNSIDIAFLDINMRGMGGLTLAEKILSIRPNCKIVFCTGYEEYAIPAFKLHASGYLMKPIAAQDVQAEIDNIKGVRQREKIITVKCFGNFEVYANGEKLTFNDYLMEKHEFPNEKGELELRYGFSFGYEKATYEGKVKWVWNNTWKTVRDVRLSLQMLFTGKAGLGDMMGPVGIVGLMSDAASSAPSALGAVVNLLRIGAFLAVNLAVMNLLPIPALDGGRALFLVLTVIIEKITRKKLDPKYEGYIHAAGMILLLGLMAIVMFKDVFRIFMG